MKKRLVKLAIASSILVSPYLFAFGILYLTKGTGFSSGIVAGLGGVFCTGFILSIVWVVTGKGIDDFMNWLVYG